MIEILATVTPKDGPGFSCGIVLWDDKVVETAPVLRFMKGWKRDRVRTYCEGRGWKVTVVHRLERPSPDQTQTSITDDPD